MSDNTHPCDYAFPVAPGDVPYWQPGMTLRDWFAGQALAGLTGNRTVAISNKSDADALASAAYVAADAMLKARAKGEA